VNKQLSLPCLVLGLLILRSGAVPAADLGAQLAACAATADDARRLQCYDQLSATLHAPAGNALTRPAVSAAPSTVAAAHIAAAGPVASAAATTAGTPVPITGAAAPASPATTVTAAPAALAAPALAAPAPVAKSDPASEKAEFGVNNGPLAAKRSSTQLKSLTAGVAKVTVLPYGQLVITLDNGQVWRQIQAVEYFPLKVGDQVEISVGALGSYVLQAPSKRVAKVTRIN
jgi:hypothetical protein